MSEEIDGTVPTPDVILYNAGDMFDFLAENDAARLAFTEWLHKRGQIDNLMDEEAAAIFKSNLPVAAEWARKYGDDARVMSRLGDLIGHLGNALGNPENDNPFAGPVGPDYLDTSGADDFADEKGEIHIDRKPEH